MKTDEESHDDFNDLKKKLKQCQERTNVIEREYKLCEKELRKKTEEAEKLKSEVKDLKEMLKLEEQLEEHEEEDPFAMKNGFKRTSPQAEPSPVKSKMSNKNTSSYSWKENRKKMVGNKAHEFNCFSVIIREQRRMN